MDTVTFRGSGTWCQACRMATLAAHRVPAGPYGLSAIPARRLTDGPEGSRWRSLAGTRPIARSGVAAWVRSGSAPTSVLGRQVALKRIGAAPGAGTPDLERAEREARLAARLNHPHVVAVFDLVEDEGTALAGHGVRRGRQPGRARAARRRAVARRRPRRCSVRWPTRWPPRTRRGSCTATSSRPTSWSPPTGR